MSWLADYYAGIREWCAGRFWPGRLVLLLAVAYVGWCHGTDADRHQWFGGVNLFVHECGHFLFAWAGEWLHVAAGSLVQCVVPLLVLFVFLRQPDYFGVGIAGIWLSTNIFGVATYIDDASALDLPLFVPFQGVEEEDKSGHDWHYLLDRAGLLHYDHRIAAVVTAIGWVVWAVAILYCLWLLVEMIRPPRASADSGTGDDQ